MLITMDRTVLPPASAGSSSWRGRRDIYRLRKYCRNPPTRHVEKCPVWTFSFLLRGSQNSRAIKERTTIPNPCQNPQSKTREFQWLNRTRSPSVCVVILITFSDVGSTEVVSHLIVTGERIHASSNLSVLLMVHQTPIVGACVIFTFFKYYIKCQFTEAHSSQW